MKKLVIDIKGQCGTGKSTIAKLIADTLDAHGINVDVYDIDGDSRGENFADTILNYDKKLESLYKSGLNVVITTTQVHREAYNDQEPSDGEI